jgi:hypothetical protein
LEDIRKISLGTSFSHILICGDFNLPEINWSDTRTSGGPNSLPYRFIECIRDSFVTQHVKVPTHKRGDQRANVLDLVFTNEEDMIDEITPLDPWGKSHHCGLIYKFKCYADQARPRWTLNFNKADYDEMRRIMGGYSWDDDLRDLTCDEAWEIFATRLNESMLKCIPKRKIGMKSTKPTWITKTAIEKAKNKKRAYQKYLQTRNEDDYKLYARARNQSRWESRRAKKDFERNIAREAKANPKAFFKYVNSRLKTHAKIPDLIVNGTKISSDQDKAQALNDYFCSVFTQEDLSNITSLRDTDLPIPGLDDITIHKEMVLKKLHKLNPSKSPGPEGFHPRILKELYLEVSGPLASIMGKSLYEGKLPREWKDAHVSPIFKKGKKTDPGNYRPVSLTSVVCKCMESILRDAIMTHMSDNRILSNCQHGFIPG